MGGLVEARRDGRLGDRERASLERHLETCSACRALERDLEEVRVLLRRSSVPAPTPLEHQRGRLALLRAAAAPSRSGGQVSPGSLVAAAL
jgi:anti-sigma factor RsiW